MQTYLDADRSPPLPPVTAGGYLIDAMQMLGPVRAQPMGGVRAADWPEIAAFAEATHAVGEEWELDALRRMCVAYAGGLEDGGNVYAIPPMDREP